MLVINDCGVVIIEINCGKHVRSQIDMAIAETSTCASNLEDEDGRKGKFRIIIVGEGLEW